MFFKNLNFDFEKSQMFCKIHELLTIPEQNLVTLE